MNIGGGSGQIGISTVSIIGAHNRHRLLVSNKLKEGHSIQQGLIKKKQTPIEPQPRHKFQKVKTTLIVFVQHPSQHIIGLL